MSNHRESVVRASNSTATSFKSNGLHNKIPQQSEKNPVNVVCYRCLGKGHFAIQCPNPRNPLSRKRNIQSNIEILEQSEMTPLDTVCYRCHEKGHFAVQCPNPRNPLSRKRNLQLDNEIPEQSEMTPLDTVCYRCHEKGHFAVLCPNPRNPLSRKRNLQPNIEIPEQSETTPLDKVCYRCQEKGHFAVQCPNPRNPLSRKDRHHFSSEPQANLDKTDSWSRKHQAEVGYRNLESLNQRAPHIQIRDIHDSSQTLSNFNKSESHPCKRQVEVGYEYLESPNQYDACVQIRDLHGSSQPQENLHKSESQPCKRRAEVVYQYPESLIDGLGATQAQADKKAHTRRGLVIKASVLGHSCRMLIHSGLKVSLIDQDYSERLGIRVLKLADSHHRQLGNGVQFQTDYLTQMITFHSGDYKCSFQFELAPLVDCEAILGLDWLSTQDIHLDWQTNSALAWDGERHVAMKV